MALATFGVDHATVASQMFPHRAPFSANSSPTSTTVTDFIQQESGVLTGKLYAENIVAATVDAATTSAAYFWCRKLLLLMVAVRVLEVASQQDPELARRYSGRMKEMLDDLDEKGGTALGDATLETGTAPADGPTTHINTFGIETDSAANMSSAVPLLRKDDRL